MKKLFEVKKEYFEFVDGAEKAMGMEEKESYMEKYREDFINLSEFEVNREMEMELSARISSKLIDDAVSNPIPLLREMGKITVYEGQKRISSKDIVLLSAFTVLMEEMRQFGYKDVAERLETIVEHYIPTFQGFMEIIENQF